MPRKKMWVRDYEKFILSKRSEQFMFGKHDCCITACDMILAITGVDPAAKFRNQYGIDNPIKALRLVKEYGDVDGIAEKVCAEHNWAEIPPAYANRGDVVCLTAGGDRKALGWVDLDGVCILAPAMIGLQERNRSDAIRAWRIE